MAFALLSRPRGLEGGHVDEIVELRGEVHLQVYGGALGFVYRCVVVLAVNREMVVTDDVPGAFAREVIAALSTAPSKSSTSCSRAGETARACSRTAGARGHPGGRLAGRQLLWGDELCSPPTTPAPTNGSAAKRCWSGSGRPTPCTRCAARKASMRTN